MFKLFKTFHSLEEAERSKFKRSRFKVSITY